MMFVAEPANSLQVGLVYGHILIHAIFSFSVLLLLKAPFPNMKESYFSFVFVYKVGVNYCESNVRNSHVLKKRDVELTWFLQILHQTQKREHSKMSALMPFLSSLFLVRLQPLVASQGRASFGQSWLAR